MYYDIVIIGAGAAGLAAASHSTKGKKVLVIEKMPVCGKKLAITGGGRCNFASMLTITEQISRIRNGLFLRHAFKVFTPVDVQDWLSGLGVISTIEEQIKLFSVNLSARRIADLILEQALSLGCEIRYNERVVELVVAEQKIHGVILGDGSQIGCQAVIVCTGGNSYQLTGSTGDGYHLASQAGHQIVEPVPALTPLVTTGLDTVLISGVVLDNAKINLYADRQKIAESSGILLFTHTGISGPAALSISGLAVRAFQNQQAVVLETDFYPAWSNENADQEFQKLLNQNGKKIINNILSQIVPASLADLILSGSGVAADKKGAEINGEMRKKILRLLKRYPLQLTGYKSWKEAMVTAGGVAVSEISPKTMESKLVKGLYFAGEVIDVDGDTGGFNLQVAFSTGITAMHSALKAAIKDEK